MGWFFKKPVRHYPSLYSEWLFEFERIGGTCIKAEDSAMLSGGELSDKKYSLDNFKRQLAAFLERQIGAFFASYTKEIETYVEENNCEYLMLIIRRNRKKYENLYFFRDFGFLDAKYKDNLISELDKKLDVFHRDLARYFNELSGYVDSMYEVSLTLKRLIEV